MTRRLCFCVVALLCAVNAFALADAPPGYKVIVNPSNPASTLDRKFLTDAFLKRSSYWSSGETIRPVDLDAGSVVRKRFSEEVLARSVSGVKNYWQQLIFAGRGVPPPELESDEAVIKYVLRFGGGIGYVSTTTDPRGAKVLVVR